MIDVTTKELFRAFFKKNKEDVIKSYKERYKDEILSEEQIENRFLEDSQKETRERGGQIRVAKREKLKKKRRKRKK